MLHLQKVRKASPGLSLGEAMKKAKKTYRKHGGGDGDEAPMVAPEDKPVEAPMGGRRSRRAKRKSAGRRTRRRRS